jgi:hypothetical protein
LFLSEQQKGQWTAKDIAFDVQPESEIEICHQLIIGFSYVL